MGARTSQKKGLWNKSLDGKKLQAQVDAMLGGLSTAEIAAFASLGIDAATATKGLQAAKKKGLPDVISVKLLVDNARQSFLNLKPGLEALMKNADKIIAETAPTTFRTHPQLSLSRLRGWRSGCGVGCGRRLGHGCGHGRWRRHGSSRRCQPVC